MKEFDTLMKALEDWSNIMIKFGGLKCAPLALQNAYLAFKAAPEPLVLEQVENKYFWHEATLMEKDSIIFVKGKKYKLPEE